MKRNFFRFKLWDKDDGYFIFSPTIYSFDRNRISFGLELFSVRVFYFEYKRLLPSSNDKMDVFVGEIIYK